MTLYDGRRQDDRTLRPRDRSESIQLRTVSFDSAEAAALLAGADAYNLALYGHADESRISPGEFTEEHWGLFLIALTDDGEPIGCGGIRKSEPPAPAGAVEVKRMFVTEGARGTGAGRRILRALEQAARDFGYREIVLDVGSKQATAHSFYEGQGYHRIPGFTIYRDKPGNRAYGKRL